MFCGRLKTLRGDGDTVALAEILLLVATSNRFKFNEIRSILSPHHLKVEMVDLKTLELQSDDLERITIAAAADAIDKTKNSILVEDAGLFVNALGGFPGPYSSYVSRTLGCDGLLKILRDVGDRRADFRSCLAYADRLGNMKVFTGVAKGRIANEASGHQGFGFDPVFIPNGSDVSFGTMNLDVKNSYSHRGLAVNKFAKWYLNHKEALEVSFISAQ